MIFIDWISTPDHRNFNKAFFSSLALDTAECFVFTSQLVIPEANCVLLEYSPSRALQALNILRIVWRNRKKCIVLLTYDSLFLPIILLTKKNIIVYEHNTTPDYGISKHLIWQSIMFNWVHRMAQYPSQHERLLKIRKNATYIGSPIMNLGKEYAPPTKFEHPFMFIAPSYRASLDSLHQHDVVLCGSVIMAKRTQAGVPRVDDSSARFSIRYLDRVEFCHEGRTVDAVIVTNRSALRGTGWFNDAISHMTPIIITDKHTSVLFQETFPEYPYLFLDDVLDSSELRNALNEIRRFNSTEYIVDHNMKLQKRFLGMLLSLPLR
jgi:hypothetical protein